MADLHDELDQVVDRLVKRRPEIRLLVLVGSCPSEVIKLDLGKAAERLNGKHRPAVSFLHFSGSGIETTFTQGEDNFLAALVRSLPQDNGANAVPLVVAGAVADVVEDQFRRIFDGLGIGPVAFLPGRRAEDQPIIEGNAGPAGAALSRRDRTGAYRPRSRDPYCALPARRGRDDSLAQDRCGSLRRGPVKVRRHHGRRPRESAPVRGPAQGKFSRASASFSSPISQLEPSIARFLSREAGCSLVEVGTPYLHRQHLAPELALLPHDVVLSEGQDVDLQLERCRAAKPDLVLCGLGLANPLEAEGMTTKCRSNSFFTPVQGYEQAAATSPNSSPARSRAASA